MRSRTAGGRPLGDPELNKMVETSLEHNWDIKKAAARVLEVQAQFRQTRAKRFPQLDLEAGAVKRTDRRHQQHRPPHRSLQFVGGGQL